MSNIIKTAGITVTFLLAACGSETDVEGNAIASDTAAGSSASADLGPLTATEICERLDGASVGTIIGVEIRNAQPSASLTPQCSYPFTSSTGSTFNITIAYLRPDGDLMGRAGAVGYDYMATMQRSNMRVHPNASESAVQAGERAVRFTGINRMHYGLLLVGGRIMTVTTFADTVQPEAVDQLLVEMASKFGR